MIKKLYLILGIILIMYVNIINKLSSTKIAFSTPVLFLGIFFIILGFTWEKLLKVINRNEVLKKYFKVFKTLVIVLISLLILIEGAIIVYPKHNKENSDYILVLGAGLSNGRYPSLTLSYRLDAAIDSFNDMGKEKKIIVSGGQGNNEDIAEAEAMKNYLLDAGIPEDMVIAEDKSRTTYENFKFSKEKIEEDSGKSIKDLNIKIVTTDFHALRSRIIAKKGGYGCINNYSSNTVWYLIPINYLRESFAVVKSVIFD